MNGTPRLRSAFPQTPRPSQRTRDPFATPSRVKSRDDPKSRDVDFKTPSDALQRAEDSNAPLIPVQMVDAPSQRLYIMTFYLLLSFWRLYESCTASDELDSTWLFLKWVSIDGIFLFGLQALRIPWLEWAFPTTLAIFLIHVVGNVFLMFRIPVCVFIDPLGLHGIIIFLANYTRSRYSTGCPQWSKFSMIESFQYQGGALNLQILSTILP